jgi:hypothetical protein
MSASENHPVQWNPDIQALQQSLQPVFAAFDEMQLKHEEEKARTLRNCLITMGVALIGALAVLLTVQNMMIFGIIICLSAVICIAMYSTKSSSFANYYRSRYKQDVFARVTSALAPGMTYYPQHFIAENYYTGCGLQSSRIDRYSGQDYFEGHVGGTHLIFSEIHAEREESRKDSKGNRRTYWVTVFKGIFFMADFPKHFQGQVIIEPDVAEATFGWLGRKLQGMSSDLVRLENPEFEKAFKVRATDQVEARYLLTPSFQDRLLELRKFWGGKIGMSLLRSNLYLAIPNREDWFECSSKVRAGDRAQIERFASQLIAVLNVVNQLDLNTRLWTKE